MQELQLRGVVVREVRAGFYMSIIFLLTKTNSIDDGGECSLSRALRGSISSALVLEPSRGPHLVHRY